MRRQAPPGSFRFSTAALPLEERRNAVGALRERGILPIEPLGEGIIDLEIAKRLLPGAGILSGNLCGLRQEGSASARDASDDLFLGINLAGRSVAAQRGHEIAVADGEAILASCAAASFAFIRPTPARFIGVRVPRKAIAPLVTGLDDRMRLVAADTPALRLLIAYLRAIEEAGSAPSWQVASVAATHLHDLFALCLGATPDAAAAMERSLSAARLEAIKSDICSRLTDASLTVSAIAARHGVTPRYVHKLFESGGTTYTRFVLEQRLDRACRMLRDRRFAARSITAIAYDAGFGDLSYFNRSFRRRFGATPSDIRNGGAP